MFLSRILNYYHKLHVDLLKTLLHLFLWGMRTRAPTPIEPGGNYVLFPITRIPPPPYLGKRI